MEKVGYTRERIYEEFLKLGAHFVTYTDQKLQTCMDNWLFFDIAEERIRQVQGSSLECVLFSKYYWAMQFQARYQELYGEDAGLEQQCYQIFEEILSQIPFDEMHWDVLQAIDEGRYDEEYWAVQ